MPELPEVEIIRRELERKIVGNEIIAVESDTPKMLRPSLQVFSVGVVGKSIRKMSRRAKLLIFELSPEGFFVCHLKLTGRLLFRKKNDRADDYVHIVLSFNDDTELRFANSRKFGYWQFFADRKSLDEVRNAYGPEPLKDLSAGQFYKILQSTRRKVKVLLMDQSMLAGVGNIYANDALWLAGIHPETPASSLTRVGSNCLFQSLQEILREALEDEGASDQWYRHTDGSKGHYQEHFKVYGRAGEKCLRCGSEIQYGKVGGRGTFFCSGCQGAGD